MRFDEYLDLTNVILAHFEQPFSTIVHIVEKSANVDNYFKKPSSLISSLINSTNVFRIQRV